MKNYYQGRHAQTYNIRWRTFTERTLEEVLPLLERRVFPPLLMQRSRPLRILDVACGTGILLKHIAEYIPDAELYGIDASQDMLQQARSRLGGLPQVHLKQVEVGPGEQTNLPFAPGSFDVITCTNTLHYFTDPGATLRGLGHLLTSPGQIVIEDYVLRGFPFPWKAFEWAIKLYDPQHVQLYTYADAQVLCRQADLRVLYGKTFQIDFFCQGWTLLLERCVRQAVGYTPSEVRRRV